jgi:hypothetical protein
MNRRKLAAWALVICVLSTAAHQVWSQQPGPVKPASATGVPSGNTAHEMASSPVAHIFGNVPVTRQDLGEFLMARGGADKVHLLVNRMIIETEAKRRNITVTNDEVSAALNSDMENLPPQVTRADFIKTMLPRYGMTYYEWMEDNIRPRLMLGKMCRDRVKVTDEDLMKQFERHYGEKRQVQILMYPLGDDQKTIQAEYAKVRTSQVEFDRAARAMANPSLAASAGYIKPISKHMYAQDQIIEKVAYELKEGEISQILQTSQGWVIMKLHKIIAPDTAVKFEAEKPKLFKEAFEERLSQEIPKFFDELRKQANPQIYYAGPTEWKAPVFKEVPQDMLKGTNPVKK